MIFQETNLKGAWHISLEKAIDERGFFARTFCQNEFHDHGLAASFVQCNLSYNYKRGTLRGMHFQISPHQEAKLVQCTQGAIFDVIIDLRPTSPTYLANFAIILTAGVHDMLYVPEGFAHGFITLEDETSIFYQMSVFYAPGAA
jgi:dTDP-4-dehydrorhamnose 3,5-epimerase